MNTDNIHLLVSVSPHYKFRMMSVSHATYRYPSDEPIAILKTNDGQVLMREQDVEYETNGATTMENMAEVLGLEIRTTYQSKAFTTHTKHKRK